MPLCIPTKHLHLTFGHRVGHGWSADNPNLTALLSSEMEKELPFISALDTAEHVAKALEPFTKRNNPHSHEAFAYTLIQTGDFAASLEARKTLACIIDGGVPWQREILTRAELVRAKLLESPQSAQQQLADWETATVRNLGLEAFWVKAGEPF